MNRILAVAMIVAVSVGASADVVAERWGSGQGCRHPGTARYAVAAGDGTAITYDLSALPAKARIHRARLLAYVKTNGFPLPRPIVVKALSRPCKENAAPAVEGPALPLVGPRYTCFDVTDVVRRWVGGQLANNGLLVAGAKIVRPRTFLEITYEGRLPAVQGRPRRDLHLD